MRYIFTMNMPSRGGQPVHQIIGEHSAANLGTLLAEIANSDFLMVEEYYVERDSHGDAGLAPHGFLLLNTMFIGKIKEAEDRPSRR